MSDPRRIEYEGPLELGFLIDEWGVIYINGAEADLLADRIMQELGVAEDDYGHDETTVANVRVTIEVLDGTLVKASDVVKAQRELGLRPSESIPQPIDFAPPPAPEIP